ncbi:MAG: bifunctional folylpolyglutamate synthase/dihydrofolate synthase [Chloroflexi bacterium]|nr:MAG: bifunctional folylpolyglutamate synthase/dihydrofolate synthase [Chloroflexota bacterium]TMD74268.1 MAG: bifunctional folylpolyglutamate synthase/dihydrofolate synthase [Chloroflexota bacterium]
MTYEEALDFISSQGRFAMKLGTERTRALLDHVGAPDRQLRGALIAGTNGKGSTGVCLSSILRAAGHNVGFMPKPHLISYTERIEVNGTPISEQDFVATLEDLMPAFEAVGSELGPPTEFEMLTVMAVVYLAPRIDVLVCEVGLGGRLDATNALDLGVALITNVDLDHQKYLGTTIGEIAREKAAIIKQGNRVVTGCEGEALQIVEARAVAEAAPVWRLGREIRVNAESMGWDGHVLTVSGPGFEHRDLRLHLLGEFQPHNAALAVAAAHLIDDVRDEAVRGGLGATVWPGRLQVIAEGPRVILDGGHNPAAMVTAGAALRRLIGSERLVAVFAMLSERDPVQLLAALRTLSPDAVVFTEPASAHGHAISPEELVTVYGPGAQAARPASAALEHAKQLAGAGGNVLVCGSLYLVGEILALRD